MTKALSKKIKLPLKNKKTKQIVNSNSFSSFLLKRMPMVLLLVSAIIALQARIRLLAIPFERDEAGFAYIGHWLLNGKSLYVDMVDNKLPGLYFLYSVFTTLFGYTPTGVHIGLLLANIASSVCLYFLIKRLYNEFVATLSTAFFILLVASPGVVGFAAHATQLLLPFALGGWLLFWNGIYRRRSILFLIAGFLLGTAFIIKQQSIVFGILAAVIWWPLRLRWMKAAAQRLPVKEWILLGVGGLLPVALTVGYFAGTGRFEDLVFWSVSQPASLANAFEISRIDLFRNVFPGVWQGFQLMWVFALVAIGLIWYTIFNRGFSMFGVLLALTGLASVSIGAAFYNHYFILALPGVALLAAITIYWITLNLNNGLKSIPLLLALILIVWPLYTHSEYFFSPSFNSIHQKAYNQNMFPETERIGQELSRRVSPNGKIGVLGSEPGILVAANRESCSKHLFMYPLLSDPETSPALQQEFINDIKTCMPEYIVWNTSTGSWAPGYDQIQMFTDLMEWIRQHYSTNGLAEIRQDEPGIIVWDEAVQAHQSESNFKIYIFKRNAS